MNHCESLEVSVANYICNTCFLKIVCHLVSLKTRSTSLILVWESSWVGLPLFQQFWWESHFLEYTGKLDIGVKFLYHPIFFLETLPWIMLSGNRSLDGDLYEFIGEHSWEQCIGRPGKQDWTKVELQYRYHRGLGQFYKEQWLALGRCLNSRQGC